MGFFDNLLGKSEDRDASDLRKVTLKSTLRLGASPPGVEFALVERQTGNILSLFDFRQESGLYELDRGERVQLSIIGSLFADEVVQQTEDDSYLLPLVDVYQLEPEDRRSLGLDFERSWKLSVRVHGIIGGGENKIHLDWTSPDGRIRKESTSLTEAPCGFVDETDGTLHVLPPELVRIRELVERDSTSEVDGVADEYRLLGKITGVVSNASAASRPMIELDQQLEKEEYLAPDEVQVDFRPKDDGSLELRPLVDGFDDFESAEELLEGGADERRYSRPPSEAPSGKTLRVALNERTLREINRVRECQTVPPEDVPEFVDNPREYLQPAEELHDEWEREAEERDVSVEEIAEDEQRRETLNLDQTVDRIGELDLEEYGDRVAGFRKKSDLGPDEEDDLDRGVSLEGSWFDAAREGVDRAETSSDGETEAQLDAPETAETDSASETSSASAGVDESEKAASKSDVGVQDDLEPASDTTGVNKSTDSPREQPQDQDDYVLNPADNDIELAYNAALRAKLEERYGDFGDPEYFDGELYPHQRRGFAWLAHLSRNYDTGDHRGGLLADDTGLGKTIQVIALFAERLERDALSPSILVVPKTLMSNWQAEIRKFCPWIEDIYVHHGTNRLDSAHAIEEKAVVITTYGTLNADQMMLGKVDFEVMVCDEAQRIKNYGTQRAAACRAMEAKIKLPLTATPVENELGDLWSIIDFCQPGLLGPLPEFREDYANQIEDTENPDIQAKAATRLLQRIQGHYLRRRKEEELDDLPTMKTHREEVPLTTRQRGAYDVVLEEYEHSSGLGDVFQTINVLLRICTHPLVVENRADGIGSRLATRDPEDVPGSEHDVVAESGKLQWIFEDVLPGIHERNEKVLIFSKFRRAQILMQLLVDSYFDLQPTIINGKASGSQRQHAVDVFCESDGFNVLVLSPRAAGVGLNIQAANHVIHVTREWNPAQVKQATDRVYRIGQEHPTVHKYIPISTSDSTSDSADERLDKLLAQKKRMANAILQPPEEAKATASDFEDLV